MFVVGVTNEKLETSQRNVRRRKEKKNTRVNENLKIFCTAKNKQKNQLQKILKNKSTMSRNNFNFYFKHNGFAGMPSKQTHIVSTVIDRVISNRYLLTPDLYVLFYM